MSVVYHNLPDMPIPSFAFPDRNKGTVFVKVLDDDGEHKRSIGKMTVDSPGHERMVPNDYFRKIYKNLWEETYPNEPIPADQMSIGMYALTLAISRNNHLYEILSEVYGTAYVNAILDYVMFIIMARSDVTQVFEKVMAKEVLFSNKLHGDSWYSELFSNKLDNDHHHLFKIKWVEHLVHKGLKKVWLAIDGSNNDCEARSSFLAKFGFPKSHNTNKTIVGYMYAVDADTGSPVTYYVYEGSVPDCQAFQWMATFLGGFNIEIEGLILDRGFAVEEVFKKITEEHWKYVIMLPTDVEGHKLMVNAHQESIRWKSQYVMEDEALFGTSDTMRLFGTHKRESQICLYFDGAGGSGQSIRLIRQIQTAKKKAERAISNGKRATIARNLRKYLTITGEGPDRIVEANYDEWDRSMSAKGYFSYAVSEGITPNLALSIYKKRDTSETLFCILKTQEGGHTTRVHNTSSIYSKFAMLFVASIIRDEIQDACKQSDLDTNPMIQGLETITLHRWQI